MIQHIVLLAFFKRFSVCVGVQRLNALAALVRGNLPKIHRNIITALITVDVHARDIVTELVKKRVQIFTHLYGIRAIVHGKTGQISLVNQRFYNFNPECASANIMPGLY